MGGEEALLWAGEGDPPPGYELVICWSGREEGSGRVSVLQEAERRADGIRRTYSEWVDGIGRCEVGGRTVVDHLDVGVPVSHWWSTLLVERNPLKSSAVGDAIRLLVLEEVLSECSVDRLEMVGGRRTVREAVSGLARHLGIRVRFSGRPSREGRFQRIRALRGWPRGWLVLAHHLWHRRHIARRRATAGDFVPGGVLLCGQLFGTTMGRAGAESNQWPVLADLVREVGLVPNRLHRFVPSSAMPDQRTAIDVARSESGMEGGGESDLLVASFSHRVAWRTLVRRCRVGRAYRRLRSLPRSLEGGPGRAWLWPVHRRDWQDSLSGGSAVLGCLEAELVEAAVGAMARQELAVCSIEFHPWERAFFDAWARHGHGPLVGYPHATVPYWNLPYHRGLGEWGDISAPLPDLLAVNGAGTRAALSDGGPSPDRLVDVEALRYLHLTTFEGSNRRDGGSEASSTGMATRVLVMTEYLEVPTAAILDLVVEAFDGADVAVRHRPHPSHRREADFASGSVTWESAGKSISEDLAWADVAVVGSWTSAGAEAVQAGVPTVMVLDRHELVQSPLRGREEVEAVTSVEDLRSAVSARVGGPVQDRPFFSVDPDLPGWRRLLGSAVDGSVLDRGVGPGGRAARGRPPGVGG